MFPHSRDKQATSVSQSICHGGLTPPRSLAITESASVPAAGEESTLAGTLPSESQLPGDYRAAGRPERSQPIPAWVSVPLPSQSGRALRPISFSPLPDFSHRPDPEPRRPVAVPWFVRRVPIEPVGRTRLLEFSVLVGTVDPLLGGADPEVAMFSDAVHALCPRRFRAE